MSDFKWKRRNNDYTVSDSEGNFLFNYNILLEKGPPPKKMKHIDALNEIKLILEAQFKPKSKAVDQEGTIAI